MGCRQAAASTSINLEAPTELQHIEPEDRCSLQGRAAKPVCAGRCRSCRRRDTWSSSTSGSTRSASSRSTASASSEGAAHSGRATRADAGRGTRSSSDVTNFRYDPVGYNKQPWLDSHGTFYTDALRVVERWTFMDANTINYEATIEDPKVFTQPWKIAFRIPRHARQEFRADRRSVLGRRERRPTVSTPGE